MLPLPNMASVSLPVEQSESVQSGAVAASRPKWGMLVILSLALAIIILDTTILNVALSSIIRDLHTTIQKMQWVITAYSLTLAALTITGGRLGDLFGRKRMFVVGAVLFAIGSFLASISTNVEMLIAGEAIIEGIGAALMMPATSSLLVVNFRGRDRAVAFGIWGAIAGAAAALGPILGGYLATNYNWRWGFRINLVVIVALLIGSVLIPESRDDKQKKELDFVGVLLSALGMLSFVFGIIEASTYGWWKAKAVFVAFNHAINLPGNLSVVPLFILLGILILIGFGWWEVRRERLGHTPLVSMKLFQNRPFTAGVSTTVVLSLGQTGLIFALPVFLQAVRGFNAFQTGVALLPMALALLIVAPLSATLGKKIQPKLLINLGLLINIAAYLVLRLTLNVDTAAVNLIPGLAMFGIGMGLVMSQINNLTLSAVPLEQAGEASGVNNTLRQVGSTLGSAIIGTILIATLGNGLIKGVNESLIIPEALKPTISQAMQSQTSNVEFGGGAEIQQEIPVQIKDELTRIGHQATVNANKESLLYGALFALLGFLVSLLLPSAKATSKQMQDLKQEKKLPIVPRAQPLTTDLIAALIQTDVQYKQQGRIGVGMEVRALIDALNAQEPVLEASLLRTSQARVLWEAGIGPKTGARTFEQYLRSLPTIPMSVLPEDVRFPSLVLVDARVSVLDLAELLGVAIKGNEQTAQMKVLQATGEAYWLRCQTGEKYLGKSVKEAEGVFGSQETTLTATEGLSLLLQQPTVIKDVYLDLGSTRHDLSDNSTACLGMWNGKMELRFRWRDHADPRCQVTSKRVVSDSRP